MKPTVVNTWGATSPRYKRQRLTHLEASKERTSTATKVLYQKVVRPSAVLPDILFLGYLVEYLESHFQLPNNLPMVYETLPGDEENRCILSWDSPLSPSSDATRMEVEVVGIYTDGKGDAGKQSKTPSVPNMAMVVVRKAKDPGSSIPPMMEGLFSDSEKRILKTLDRGLEDFIAGKIKFQEDGQRTESKIQNVRTAEEAIQAELVDNVPGQSTAKVAAEDVVFDTYATDDTEVKPQISEKARAAAMASMQVKADPEKPETSALESNHGDFAVRAAKEAAQKRSQPAEDFAVAAARIASKNKKSKPTEDFAVAAAKRVSTKKKTNKSKEKSVKGSAVKPTKTVAKEQPTPEEVEKSFKIADYMGDARAFRTTISRPADRRAKNKKAKLSKQNKEAKISAIESAGSKKEGPDGMEKSKTKNHSGDISKIKASIEEKRKLNVKVMDSEEKDITDDINPLGGMDESTMDSGINNTPSKEQMELDVIKAAQKVMSELAEQGEDMTPEELLQDVLKFDDEQKKENEAGSGFVSGAFEKAKELMRERHRQREARLREKSVEESTRDLIGIMPDIVDTSESATPATRKMTAEEEELRQMFEAGERIADGRISASLQQQGPQDNLSEEIQDEDVDTLIAKDKSISSYARVLDDELAELEVCINSSPGEEFDGPRQNPIFDIMSGPEVYNPNVDLDAVNFPGALPGTKEVTLPNELGEAIKQAEFAVSILSSLKTVESEDGDDSKVKFFAGKREISRQQAENLRKVVVEATEIGLINDPIKMMEERSRLQIVLDELWNQPKERFYDIAENYKDLLLSDNFVKLVKERLSQMADRDLDALRFDDESLKEPHAREREILGQLVVYAQVLLKQTRALGAELEAQQLEVVRSICKVAMDPRHTTEEETSIALSDAVRDMRPLLDDGFVAYLKYAVAEEEARLARAGLLDDPEHNQWLFVLKIVQQGVYAEIAKGINRYIEHIWYVLRMETSKQRRMLLEKLIDDMPTMDVRPFIQVVENIVGSLGDGVRGEFDGVTPLGEMTNKLLQLHRDVKDLLPPERIALKSRDADEWAAKQREKLLKARNLGEQRLQAARDTAYRQDEIDALGRRGEMDIID